MSLSFRIATVLLGAAVATSAWGQASTVYKWTDDKGVVQYTDAPPDGRKFERMEVGGSGKARAADPTQAVPASSTAGEPSPAQRRLDTMKANCDTARKNLETMERFPVVTADTNNDGIAETLDGATRDSAIEQNRELVRQYCLDPSTSSRDGEG
jgi:hypothetical protein